MEIYEKAPAKINLGLDVLYKRADDYHELRMVMASVDLADHLKIESLPTDEIIVTSNKAFLPVDKRNNVYQAAEMIGDAASKKYNELNLSLIFIDKS